MPSDAGSDWRYDILMLLDAAKWKCRLCRLEIPLLDQNFHVPNRPCDAAGINEMMERQVKAEDMQ